MSASPLSRIYKLVEKNKRLIVKLLGAVILISLISLKFIRYNNNIESMLPADPQVQQSMRFLRESNFSDKLIISLKLKDNQYTTQDLISATDQLINSIKSPLVKQVIGNVSGTNLMQEMIFFLQYSPQLLGPESIAKLKTQITPSGIEERLKFIYRQSLTPGSSFLMPFLRADPLNLSSEILRNIQKLSTSSGYDVTLDNGHFISRDGKSAMVIIKTSVLLTEGFGSRKIVKYLQEKLAALPDFVSANIIAGHMHTVKNEDVIKKDIWLTSVIAALGFLLLFLFFFRDFRAIIIFLMPFAAVLISTCIAFLVFKNLSYFVIGLSAVIAGISIDYGIYVFMAVRKAGNSLETLRQIIKPVLFSALTTLSIFAVFFLSNVEGYHQLAFFSNLSIILCLGFALFILPHFLSKEDSSGQTNPVIALHEPSNSNIPDYILVITWVVFIIVMIGFAGQLRFNNDINQFDGAGREVFKSEEEFHNTWGAKSLPAVFVTCASTLKNVYELNTSVYEAAIKAVGKDNFNSLVAIWPGLSSRQANLAGWKKFWNKAKEDEFKGLLATYGKTYNFSPDAFNPFFQKLRPQVNLEVEPRNLVFFDQLKDQFVLKKESGYQMISFFPDEDKFIQKLSVVSKNYPGTFLVSRKNFSQQISQALSGELAFLAFLAVFATLGLTFLLLRNLRLTILAMVPVITALAMIAGVMRLLGLSLNMSSIIAAMVVLGIVSDYGMFVVYYCKYGYKTGTYFAVTFAALTTLIGTGVLLFAQHPVLFSIGVTLTTGVLTGYLSSLLIIPALYRLWRVKENVPA
jgi:uncharacterized protein